MRKKYKSTTHQLTDSMQLSYDSECCPHDVEAKKTARYKGCTTC